MANILCVFLFSFIVTVIGHDYDYYWKEYNGAIPEDALAGGKDLNGRDTYIGQAYIHGHGVFVVQLFPGILEVNVPCYGVRKTDKVIKILCSGSRQQFQWLTTSAKTFHVDTINKHAVVGGYDHVGNKGVLNIGRLMYQGMVKIGAVNAFQLGNALMHFPHLHIEQKANMYDVLIYNELPVYDLDIRQGIE